MHVVESVSYVRRWILGCVGTNVAAVLAWWTAVGSQCWPPLTCTDERSGRGDAVSDEVSQSVDHTDTAARCAVSLAARWRYGDGAAAASVESDSNAITTPHTQTHMLLLPYCSMLARGISKRIEIV